jgi:hypothetical protein
MTEAMKPAEALRLLLDQVDYTTGACRVNEMVGAALPEEVIEHCRRALVVAALETENDDALRTVQAFNASLLRHIHSLIETTKRIGAPNAATLIECCERMIRTSALEALGGPVVDDKLPGG